MNEVRDVITLQWHQLGLKSMAFANLFFYIPSPIFLSSFFCSSPPIALPLLSPVMSSTSSFSGFLFLFAPLFESSSVCNI